MKRILLFFLGIFVVTLVVTGCSSDNTSGEGGKEKGKTSSEEEEMDIPEAAADAEGMLEEGPGKLSTTGEADAEELEQELGQLPDDFDVDEAYNYLTYLMAADYESTLKKYEEFDPTFNVDGAPKSENSDNAQEKQERKTQRHC